MWYPLASLTSVRLPVNQWVSIMFGCVFKTWWLPRFALVQVSVFRWDEVISGEHWIEFMPARTVIDFRLPNIEVGQMTTV